MRGLVSELRFYRKTAENLACSMANFLSSTSRQTYEFVIIQWIPKADNLAMSYRKKQIDVSF